MELEGRLAIIAGGLGGIGSATGKALRAQGARLALLYAPFEEDKKEELLRQGYGQAAFPGGEIRAYACDVTSPESVQAAFARIAADAGLPPPSSGTGEGASEATDAAAAAVIATPPKVFPSILVNSAGYVSLSPLEDTPPEETQKHLAINILGPMLCSQAFARLYFRASAAVTAAAASGAATASSSSSSSPSALAKPPPGRIVSVSSQAAHAALWHHGAYCASKAGLEGLTRSMASEWAPRGITANTVAPTAAWTDMGQRAWGAPGVADAFLAQVPTGRFVLPEEVADAVAFLCRDSSGMINGADIRVDGGFTIR